MPERETKSSDKDLLELLRRTNLQQPPKPAADLLPALSYYDRHPEHRPRKQTRRSMRRIAIRGGYY
jgi:hypothetical protein